MRRYLRPWALHQILKSSYYANPAHCLPATPSAGGPICYPQQLEHELRLAKIVARFAKVEERKLIWHAFLFAQAAHLGQFRNTGEPFIAHPVRVAEIVALKFGMDAETVAAALLHDTVEDGKQLIIKAGHQTEKRITVEDIRNYFGDRIARMVDGLTELGKEPAGELLDKPSKTKKMHKMAALGRQAIEIFYIKIADRLDNMRTIGSNPAKSIEKNAKETLDYFVPLCAILGSWEVKHELEDLAFSYLNPQSYEQIKRRREEITRQTKEAISGLAQRLKMIPGVIEIKIEQRSLYEIQERIKRRNISNIDALEATDIWRLNVIAEPSQSCIILDFLLHDLRFRVNSDEPVKLFIGPRNRTPNGSHEFIHLYIGFEGGDFPALIHICDEEMFARKKQGYLVNPDYGHKSRWLSDFFEHLANAMEGGEAPTPDEVYQLVEDNCVRILVRLDENRFYVPENGTILDAAATGGKITFQNVALAIAYAIAQGKPYSFSYIPNDTENLSYDKPPQAFSWQPQISLLDSVRTLTGRLRLSEVLVERFNSSTEEQGRVLDEGIEYFDTFTHDHYLPAKALIKTKLFQDFIRNKLEHTSVDDFIFKIATARIRPTQIRAIVNSFIDHYFTMKREGKTTSPRSPEKMLIAKADDRPKLASDISAPFGRCGINITAQYASQHNGGKAALFFVFEGVAPACQEIHELQIATIIAENTSQKAAVQEVSSKRATALHSMVTGINDILRNEENSKRDPTVL